jgi:NAD(P)H dehydrogenase (quinone)
MLGITGATGKLGGKVASRLEKLGVAQRLIVRDAKRAPDLQNAEIAQVSSYSDTPGMVKALTGVKTLFLISAQDRMGANQKAAQTGIDNPEYDRLKEQKTAIDAAVAAGVKQVVYLSFLGASESAVFILNQDHYYTEQYIRKAGIAFTFLRPCLYLENLPLRVSAEGIIRAPAGIGKAGWVTRDDIADVAVAVLTGKGHQGKTYDVTGPEALSMAQVAQKIAAASGKKVTYVAQPPEETWQKHNASGMDKFEADRRALTGKGLDDYEVEVWVTHYLQIVAGDLDVVSDTVPKLTGHKAQSLGEYLKLHPESYQHIGK